MAVWHLSRHVITACLFHVIISQSSVLFISIFYYWETPPSPPSSDQGWRLPFHCSWGNLANEPQSSIFYMIWGAQYEGQLGGEGAKSTAWVMLIVWKSSVATAWVYLSGSAMQASTERDPLMYDIPDMVWPTTNQPSQWWVGKCERWGPNTW